MRKLICKDITCKYHSANNVCSKPTVEIVYQARCNSYEKGFHYYVNLVWDKLDNSNFIPANDLTQDMRIGLYYVMNIWNLSFYEREYGTWRMIQLVKEEGGNGLKYEEIIKLPMNMEKLHQLREDFNNGILPGSKAEPPKKTSQPFGWLSPTGEFTEGDWGEHEQAAYDIINKKGFYDEWDRHNSLIDTARDFLSEAKGYVLIHNPCGDGGYIVSHVKPLTKKQKEFLYEYFTDIGDRFKAEQYMSE